MTTVQKRQVQRPGVTAWHSQFASAQRVRRGATLCAREWVVERKRGECLAEGLSNVRVLIQMYNICQRPPVLCSRGRSSMLVLTVEVDSALGTTQ